MPMFEYVCQCGHTQDEIRPYTERDNHAQCEKCNATMQRIEVSHTAFVLKGNGWTDKHAGSR